mgnify:CR=1 FL=1
MTPIWRINMRIRQSTQEKLLKLASLVLLRSFTYKVKSGIEMVETMEEVKIKKNLQRLGYGYRQINKKLAYESV